MDELEKIVENVRDIPVTKRAIYQTLLKNPDIQNVLKSGGDNARVGLCRKVDKIYDEYKSSLSGDMSKTRFAYGVAQAAATGSTLGALSTVAALGYFAKDIVHTGMARLASNYSSSVKQNDGYVTRFLKTMYDGAKAVVKTAASPKAMLETAAYVPLRAISGIGEMAFGLGVPLTEKLNQHLGYKKANRVAAVERMEKEFLKDYNGKQTSQFRDYIKRKPAEIVNIQGVQYRAGRKVA